MQTAPVTKRVAVLTTLFYLLGGGIWILSADYLFQAAGRNDSPDSMSVLQVQKLTNILFVIISAAVLYVLIHRSMRRLEQSQMDYRELFRHNPVPLYIFETDSGKFLAVNEACCKQYGYSYRELKQLTVNCIRASSNLNELGKQMKSGVKGLTDVGYWKHVTKAGEELWVHLYARNVVFNKKEARIVLAINVHEQIIAKEKLEIQNEKLSDLAWFQSHKLRAPIARVLGLIKLLELNAPDSGGNRRILEHLEKTGKELDEVVKELSLKTIQPEQQDKVA